MAVFQSLGTPQPQQPQAQNSEPSRAKKVLRYTMMPEILPRIRGLGIHFGHFAYLLALVFASARLIPQAHPVMNAANIGRFGVRQVIAIAANNLTWSMKNIDQIAIFSAIMMGMIMIVIQLGLIAVMVLTGNEAMAQEDPSSFFVNPDPATDPVIIFLAQVFGDLDGFWGAGYTEDQGRVFGTDFHAAIHRMLSIYSMATMVIAVIVVLYYILTVIGEAAKTGTPFGQRFNSLWAPIRLIVALGLLVPLGSGLNSAQYITLWMAKQGSGLGTTVWKEMATLLNSDASSYMVGEFKNDWVSEAAIQVFFMEVCRQGEAKYNPDGEPITPKTTVDEGNTFKIVYQKGEDWFGETHVKCGELSISLNEEEENANIIGNAAMPYDQMFDVSKQILERLTGLSGEGTIAGLAQQVVASEISVGGAGEKADLDSILNDVIAEGEEAKSEAFNSITISDIENEVSESIQTLIDRSQNSWIWSGVWYLELSRYIAAGADARANIRPNMIAGEVDNELQTSKVIRRSANSGGSYTSRYINLKNASEETKIAVDNVFKHYDRNKENFIDMDEIPQECEGIGDGTGDFMASAACAVVSLIVPDELTILASDSAESKKLDPMSTLVAAGYGILQKSWTAIGIGFASSAVGSGIGAIAEFLPVFGALASIIGGVLKAIGAFAILIGALGITAGFILYFLLPVLPFVYFFFAVVSWVMEIFEAIVAMPLWALAHLQIGGDGMPGQAAMNGYYLLLAILLRPALIVIGLVAGALIFSGAIFLLQTLFENVLLVKGSGSSTGLEVLIYALIFAYLCYSAGITSFKLVDGIPNQIMRWIGAGVNTFSDGKDDPVGGNQQIMAAAGGFVGSQLAGQMSQGASGLGQGLGKYGASKTPEGKRQELMKQMQGEVSMKEYDKHFGDGAAEAKMGAAGIGKAGLDGKDGGLPSAPGMGKDGKEGKKGERGDTGKDLRSEDVPLRDSGDKK